MLTLSGLALARSAVERAAELRNQPEALHLLWSQPSTKVLRVRPNHVACAGEELLLLPPHQMVNQEHERLFLGLDSGVAYFAVIDESEGEEWRTLRDVGHLLSAHDVGLATHAIALANWHASHTHCPRCGAPTVMEHGGSIRRCTFDGTEHYPRTDPAVIVLVRDASDRILLGRQAVWPPKRYSTFAGFVEPGESFEAAVTREVKEEAGVDVVDVAYLGSQPWPFPASIMVSFVATTHHPDAAKADGQEIETVLWLSRDDLRRQVAQGEILLPPSISIARRMIEAWNGEPLEGGQAWR